MHAHEYPEVSGDWLESVFERKEFMLLVQSNWMLFLIQQITKQPGLPEQKRLQLKELVVVFLQHCQRQGSRQHLKRIAVLPETEASGQKKVKGFAPVALRPIQQLLDSANLLLQALDGQSVQEKADPE